MQKKILIFLTINHNTVLILYEAGAGLVAMLTICHSTISNKKIFKSTADYQYCIFS